MDQGGVEIEDVFESWGEVHPNFEGMNLKEELLCGINACGLEKPCAVQQRAIVPCIVGRDVVVQAPPGYDRSTAISIAILQNVDASIRECQALLLTPKRQLALDINQVVVSLSAKINIQSHVCIGGGKLREDIRKISRGFHVIVGTPGRVLDMIRRKVIDTSRIRVVAFDEAHQLQSRDFTDQVLGVFDTLPGEVQIILMSSTASISSDVMKFVRDKMKKPIRISIEDTL